MTIGPFDIFLKLDGTDGESTVKGHEKEIIVLSYAQGIDAPPTTLAGSGGASGKPTFSGVRFRKNLDKASIPILLACAAGTHIKSARFAFRRTGTTTDFYDVTLTDVVVRHIAQFAGTGSQYPLAFDALNEGANASGLLDEVTLSYSKVQWEYHSLAGSSSVVKGGWNLKTNTKI